jgi:putative ABC transport system permease protein
MSAIARKNLLHDIPRFLVAQAGIMFAVGLVTMQTGIHNGFAQSSSLLIDHSKADLWIAAENMAYLGLTSPLPYTHLVQARRVEGIDRVEALIIEDVLWRSADDHLTAITLIGADPDGQLFAPWNLTQGSLGKLKSPYTAITDLASLNALEVQQLGDQGIVGALPARIVGLTQGIQSLILGDVLFTSLDTSKAYLTTPLTAKLPCRYAAFGVACETPKGTFPPKLKALIPQDSISFLLARAKPGIALSALQKRLEKALPHTRAHTRIQMSQQIRSYWEDRSGIGFVLGLGAVVGVIVGGVVVGQILYSLMSEHLKEFGTLKAMGAPNRVIYSVILEQALWMAVLGYLPGMALCVGIAHWASTSQGFLILITPLSAISVLGLTIAMCVGSAVVAVYKVTQVDPAIVFKS